MAIYTYEVDHGEEATIKSIDEGQAIVERARNYGEALRMAAKCLTGGG